MGNVQLEKYAEVIIKVALNLQPGQRLWIGFTWGMSTGVSLELAPFVRVLTKQAYLAGASYVHVAWNDPEITRLRLLHGSEDALQGYSTSRLNGLIAHVNAGGAWLSVADPAGDQLTGVDASRIAVASQAAAEHMQPLWAASGNIRNSTIVDGVTAAWAQQVYPGLPADDAVDKLWRQIFKLCRLDTDDAVAAWTTHMNNLVARGSALEARQFDMLHYRAPGTDLRVGLVKNHVWRTPLTFKDDIGSIRNFPTEEVFTMPHRDRVDGTVRATKPFVIAGLGMIEGMRLTFEGGRVTHAEADKGQSALNALLANDEGTRRLGEVALVPHSSPISQADTIFYSTLLDENASCHMALGRAIASSVQGGRQMSLDDLAAVGGNLSNKHEDFMMGSDELDVDGIYADGRVEPIMRGGEWAFDLSTTE